MSIDMLIIAQTHTHTPNICFGLHLVGLASAKVLATHFPAKVRTWTNMVALQPVEYSEFGVHHAMVYPV